MVKNRCISASVGNTFGSFSNSGRTSTRVAGTAFGASSLTTVMQMVAGGYGVTLIPQIAADVEQRDERVKFLRLQNPQQRRKNPSLRRKSQTASRQRPPRATASPTSRSASMWIRWNI